MPADRAASPERQPTAKPWFQKVGALLCLCSVLLASGFHTLALQSYGWARMFAAYSDSLPSAEALELAFSGDELCGICVLSQELTGNLSESLKLSLGEQTTLANPAFASIIFTLPEAKPVQDGAFQRRTYQEITLEFEPPPPRRA